MKPLVIVIAGPTAVGKTAAAIQIAQALSCSIISADSRQFYSELDIGVARPSQVELQAAKHFFIADRSVEHPLTAGQFAQEASSILNDELNTKGCVIITGGSGLFIQSLTHPLDDFPAEQIELRKQLEIEWQEDKQLVIKKLLKKDPTAATKIDLQNSRRVIRALEILSLPNTTLDSFDSRKQSKAAFNTVSVYLNRPRYELYNRINQRVDLMMEAGLLDEVKSVKQFSHLPSLQTVGYTELFAYLDGSIHLEEAINKIKQNSRRYAKRQLTWFRNRRGYISWPAESIPELIQYCQRIRDAE